MIDYEYYYEQYRRVPRNSVNTQRDLLDYHSTVFPSTCTVWPASIKRSVTTAYIDGRKLLDLHDSPYGMNGSFPKGKSRRKPFRPSEKKINTGDVSISLLPAEKATVDTPRVRSEKTRSALSTASSLPDVQRKRNDNRLCSATAFDDKNNETKFYARFATTQASGAWVRRYKSVKQSQILTALSRDQAFRDKSLLRKQTTLLSSSLTLSFASSLNKRGREKC